MKKQITFEQLKRLVKESDEVKLQMIALKKAYDQIKAGKREGKAGNWKIEALGRWNDDLGLLEHGAHWVYFKDAAILEINYETREYAYLMETAILDKDMVDAMLDTLECKDFKLVGDDLPGFISESEELDQVYVDGLEVTAPNRFGLNKRWKTWFFHSPQEALRFCKNMKDKADGSSVDVIRHAFDRLKMHSKDPDESWKEAIQTIQSFASAKVVTMDLGDLGEIQIPGDMDVERLQNKVLDFIRSEVENHR